MSVRARVRACVLNATRVNLTSARVYMYALCCTYISPGYLYTHARMGECVRARMSAFCRTKLTRLSRQRINKSALTMNPPVCYYPIITGTQLQASLSR